jgi:hypothetical protein
MACCCHLIKLDDQAVEIFHGKKANQDTKDFAKSTMRTGLKFIYCVNKEVIKSSKLVRY